jgi:uncharacterized coiled-coil protein SlyX
MEADFERQLEAVAERAISADSRSLDNTRDISALQKYDAAQQTMIDKMESRIAADKVAIEHLQSQISEQQRINAEQENGIVDLQRRLAAAVDRLDGKGLLQVDPYERIVATVREHSDVLRGGEGQLSFSQLRNSIQQTQFLGQVIKAMIGLFGVGGVTAAGFALFGGSSVPPEVQAIQQKVADIRSDVDKLQTSWEADLQRRLAERK